MINSWGLRVVIRKDKMKDGGRCPLHWEATLNGKVYKFTTGRTLEVQFWDNKKKEARKGCGYAMELNGLLRATRNDFDRRMLELENSGTLITKRHLSMFFKGEEKVRFYDFFQKMIDLWEGAKAESTINGYKNTLKILKLMDAHADFGDVNYEFVHRWDHYLRTVRKNVPNGMYNRHKCLKAIIKEAILQGHMKQNPYNHFRIKHGDAKREFLTIDEVKRLMRMELVYPHEKLQRSLDMFLFGCLTGLRFSDVINLKWRNIWLDEDGLQGTLTVNMQKTGKEIQTRLIPPAVAILKKVWSEEKEKPVFEEITNQAINRNMKTLMKLAGIDKRITFHCSRHTFASNHLEIDTPIANLKDLLGHANFAQTQIYAKTLQKGLIKSMDNLGNAYA